jgi:hypothetical protein
MSPRSGRPCPRMAWAAFTRMLRITWFNCPTLHRTGGTSPRSTRHLAAYLISWLAMIRVSARAVLKSARAKSSPAVHPSERAQAADDVGDALQPVGVLVQELRHVLDEEVDIQIALKLEDLALRPAFAVGAHERHQVAEVVAERAEVAGHEADRIVDLVRHARRELPDGRQSFGVEQLRVGRREFAHGLQVPDGLGEAGGQAIEEFGSPGAEVVALGVEEHQRQRIGPPVDLGHDRRACRGWAERIAAGAAPGVEVDHRPESA